MELPFFKKHQTLEELQEENERAELQFSIEQKKAMIREAKKRGVSLKSFGGSFQALFKWLKTH